MAAPSGAIIQVESAGIVLEDGASSASIANGEMSAATTNGIDLTAANDFWPEGYIIFQFTPSASPVPEQSLITVHLQPVEGGGLGLVATPPSNTFHGYNFGFAEVSDLAGLQTAYIRVDDLPIKANVRFLNSMSGTISINAGWKAWFVPMSRIDAP